MLFGNTIASRVQKAIKLRVQTAQKVHDEKCKELDEWCETTKREAETHRDTGKEAHADEMVKNIIGN